MNRQDAIQLARKLRKNSTEAELRLWKEVRNRMFHGYKFTRQFPIEFKLYDNKSNFFMADFYCHLFKLIVEVDGDYHLKPEIKLYDKEREEILESMGYQILRFKNHEIMINIGKVKHQLLQKIQLLSTLP